MRLAYLHLRPLRLSCYGRWRIEYRYAIIVCILDLIPEFFLVFNAEPLCINAPTHRNHVNWNPFPFRDRRD
jgi:hypothetical protein